MNIGSCIIGHRPIYYFGGCCIFHFREFYYWSFAVGCCIYYYWLVVLLVIGGWFLYLSISAVVLLSLSAVVLFVIGSSILCHHHHLTMEEVMLLDSPASTEPSPRPPPVKDVDFHYFLEDEEITAPLKATITKITLLIEGRMLTTTLIDYLLQRFINPTFITPKMIVPSSEFMPRMKMQLDKLSKTDRSSQKQSLRYRQSSGGTH
jgi:hypothetical protein